MVVQGQDSHRIKKKKMHTVAQELVACKGLPWHETLAAKRNTDKNEHTLLQLIWFVVHHVVAPKWTKMDNDNWKSLDRTISEHLFDHNLVMILRTTSDGKLLHHEALPLTCPTTVPCLAGLAVQDLPVGMRVLLVRQGSPSNAWMYHRPFLPGLLIFCWEFRKKGSCRAVRR